MQDCWNKELYLTSIWPGRQHFMLQHLPSTCLCSSGCTTQCVMPCLKQPTCCQEASRRHFHRQTQPLQAALACSPSHRRWQRLSNLQSQRLLANRRSSLPTPALNSSQSGVSRPHGLSSQSTTSVTQCRHYPCKGLEQTVSQWQTGLLIQLL